MMTPEQIKNIEVYFAQAIEPEVFARQMRRFIRAAVDYYLKDDEMLYHKDISEGYYQLTEFLEQIDPVLEEPK